MTDDIELLDAVIARTGLSDGAFARLLAWRDKRTVTAWRSRTNAIPESVRARLRALHAMPPGKLARLVALVTESS